MCYNKIMNLNISDLNTYELAALAVAGLLLLFAGYRIKKFAFFIMWFILGFMLMTEILPFINEWVPEIATSSLWQNLLPLAGGLLLALLGFTIEKICLAGLTFGLTMVITINYFGTEPLTLGIGAVVGVILGAIAVRMMKPAIIIASSLAGAYAVTLALLASFPDLDSTIFYFPSLAVFTALGSLIQFKTNKT